MLSDASAEKSSSRSPSECPMSQAQGAKECPIQHSSGDDIDPLNMVCVVECAIDEFGVIAIIKLISN